VRRYGPVVVGGLVGPDDVGAVLVGLVEVGLVDVGLVDVGAVDVGAVDVGLEDVGPVVAGVVGSLVVGCVVVCVVWLGGASPGLAGLGLDEPVPPDPLSTMLPSVVPPPRLPPVSSEADLPTMASNPVSIAMPRMSVATQLTATVGQFTGR
jgi:hypothetical protein